MTPLRVTPKEAKRLGAKPTPRDSSHERDAPEAERMPGHVHAYTIWQRQGAYTNCPQCGTAVWLMMKFEAQPGTWGREWLCLDCATCPECGVTARVLWERANR